MLSLLAATGADAEELPWLADLALPGMTVSTSSDDWRINKQFQMMKFDGQRWVLFGPIVTDEYKTN